MFPAQRSPEARGRPCAARVLLAGVEPTQDLQSRVRRRCWENFTLTAGAARCRACSACSRPAELSNATHF